MTSTGVKGLNLFSNASISANTATSSTGQTENFDDTFKSMKSENASEKTNIERAEKTGRNNSKVDEMTSTKTRNPVKQEEEVTDEQIAAMSDEIVGQAKQFIMNKLEVTEEQLNEAISELGLTEESLLNPSDLSQLVMKLEGIETQGDMLTNPDFAKNLKDILSTMEEIKENVTVENLNFEEVVTDVQDEKIEETVSEPEILPTVDEEVSVEEDVDTTVPKVATLTTETETDAMQKDADGNQSSGLLQHNEPSEVDSQETVINDNQMLTPQDFAAKLTADLTEQVGETKANDIVRQVIDQAQVQVKQGVTSMEMQLYPEHLGKVLIQVSTHDGHVTAQITAESEAAKTALESQLTLLKENLNNQGLKIENVEVTIASHAFEQNMQGERGNDEQTSQSRKGRRSIGSFFGDGNEEISDIEQEKIMEITGSTVSYSA